MTTENESTVEEELRFPQANVAAVEGIADVLDTSFGPLSRDKFIGESIASKSTPDGTAHDEYVVTSDGGTILESLPMEHPIAPVFKRIVGDERPGETDVEGERVTDGVTGTVMLAGLLLSEAEELIADGLHPTTIREGYATALETTEDALRSARRPLTAGDDATDRRQSVAQTVMTGNDVGGKAERWASIATEAADMVGYPTPNTLGIESVSGGSVEDARLVRGTILPRNTFARDEMPTEIEDANVLVLSGYKRTDAADGRVGGLRNPELQADATLNVSSPDDIDDYNRLYAERREQIVDRLVAADVDVVFCRLGIDTEFLEALVAEGIAGVRGVNRNRLTRIARATGAAVVHDPREVSAADLGFAGRVAEIDVGKRSGRRSRRRGILVEDCSDPDSVTVFLPGLGSERGVEAGRQIRKGAAAVALASGDYGETPGVVPGGGAVDIGIARDVRRAAQKRDSRLQVAMLAFADAVEGAPAGLARNAGLDPLDTVSELVTASNGYDVGLVFPGKRVGDAVEAGILDPYATRRHSYVTAVEVVGTILRIDDAVDADVPQTPADEGEAIYDDRAEKHQDHLEEHGTDGTVWG